MRLVALLDGTVAVGDLMAHFHLQPGLYRPEGAEPVGFQHAAQRQAGQRAIAVRATTVQLGGIQLRGHQIVTAVGREAPAMEGLRLAVQLQADGLRHARDAQAGAGIGLQEVASRPVHAQRDAHVEHHGAHRLQRHVGRQDGAGGLAGGNAPCGKADGHFLVDLLVAADDGARRGQTQAAAVVDAVERAAHVDIGLARCAVEQACRAGLQAAGGQRDVAADLVGELQLVVKARHVTAAGTRQLLLAGADLRHVGLDAALGLIQEGLRGLAADAAGHLVAGLGQGREHQQRRHREGEDRSSGKLCPAGGEGRQTTRVCDRGPHDCCTQIDVATMFQGADGAPRIALREGGNP